MLISDHIKNSSALFSPAPYSLLPAPYSLFHLLSITLLISLEQTPAV
ncbi:MAG: hypothetical protein F6K56_39770 [Moorea sp. SIO3G5]|nr:hypothetical protein [Moorena sp. SIO3G5]